MASPQSFQRLFGRAKIEHVVQTADATTAVAIANAWKDMRDYETFSAIAFNIAMTGAGITKVEIVAADDTSGTNITVIKDSGTVAADALGDFVALECSAAEIRQESEDAGLSLRYVNLRLTAANAADDQGAVFIRSDARHTSDGLTATTIA